MPARGLLLIGLVVVFAVVGTAGPASSGDDVLRPQRPSHGRGCGTLADLGERALERLPWDTKIIRANLSAERPVAVVACYLMRKDLLVVTQTGLVYCLDRRDLTPRWVSALKSALVAVPSEGPLHYTFLVKACDGSYWVQAWLKRSGAEAAGFPARLGFAATPGIANSAGRVWIGSLGSPRDNKTLASLSLADGKPGWGWRTSGLLWASPVIDPSGSSLIIVGETGQITALPTSMLSPSDPLWQRRLTGAVSATPRVTPAHVLVGCHDGTLQCLDVASGETMWFKGIDAPIRTSPWVVGKMATTQRSSEVEGAAEIDVEAFTGVALARNPKGLFAYDLKTGDALFHTRTERRPICLTDKYLITMDGSRTLVLRDRTAGYDVKARLGLQMFDLVPTNATDGAIYGCTHDGGIVAAVPAK